MYMNYIRLFNLVKTIQETPFYWDFQNWSKIFKGHIFLGFICITAWKQKEVIFRELSEQFFHYWDANSQREYSIALWFNLPRPLYFLTIFTLSLWLFLWSKQLRGLIHIYTPFSILTYFCLNLAFCVYYGIFKSWGKFWGEKSASFEWLNSVMWLYCEGRIFNVFLSKICKVYAFFLTFGSKWIF